MDKPTIPDHSQRQQALDPSQSFIVQAPAGSGKTELLAQRFLTLLAHVHKEPEEVLAITFTRKAAAEMRSRISQALQHANSYSAPTATHALTTWQLAQKVLVRDQQLAWNVLQNPNRLRIQTIDALCNRIIQQMPVLSHCGSPPQIRDDVRDLYQDAARQVLKSLVDSPAWEKSLNDLLLHLDNDVSKVEHLFSDMLARRDQWLNHIMGHNPREALEAALANLIQEQLQTLHQTIPTTMQTTLLEIVRYSAAHLASASTNTTLKNLQDLNQLPDASLESLGLWRYIAQLFLTKNFAWRRSVTKKQGFLSPLDALNVEEKQLRLQCKEKFLNLVELYRETPCLLDHFHATLLLPPAQYTQQQWNIISALVELLPLAVAELQLLFQQHNKVDHTEISLRALQALGSFTAPSELALALDYQIQHILVDEFQDTSLPQFRLLELLTAGWQTNDGRTLFVVGDPMQSIYRFRKAEVSLFMRAQQFGIGQVRLKKLALSTNFRSSQALITWVNQTFTPLFPSKHDLHAGAIPFHPAYALPEATTNLSAGPAVQLHTIVNEQDSPSEAAKIVNIVQTCWQNDPTQRIAILVLARSHLIEIIPALKEAEIPYQAVEIDTLAHRPLIQDLLALTKALLHPYDHIAWLAILRAPWCGLTLADLWEMAKPGNQLSLWERLVNYPHLNLSPHGQQRCATFVAIMQAIFKQRKRLSLAHWVETAWLALGGPACANSASDLADTRIYFDLLHELDQGSDLVDFSLLQTKLAKLAAATTPPRVNCVEIMTIHKAKGLEFDTVILPCLEKTTKADQHQLLVWQEHMTAQGEQHLLLAPIKAEQTEPIYDYLRYQENIKTHLEQTRLLYVAVTRAKQNLHLIATLAPDEKKLADYKNPASGSLLNKLWPVLQEAFMCSAPLQKQTQANNTSAPLDAQDNAQSEKAGNLIRLNSTWRHPLYQLQAQKISTTQIEIKKHPPMPHDQSLRIIGTAVHHLLHMICMQGIARWDPNHLKAQEPYIKNLLRMRGLTPHHLASATQQIMHAIQNTLSDQRGLWILQPQQDAQTEFGLSYHDKGTLQHLIIDRTFVADNRRWIIDFKTSEFNAAQTDLTVFLSKAKQRHHDQLNLYANAMRALDDRPISCGLYFPLVPAWIEWDFYG